MFLKSEAKVIFLFHPTLRCIGGLQFDVLKDAGFNALILINLFPVDECVKFDGQRICGKDKNIFSFSCLANKTDKGNVWNTEAFRKIKKAIEYFSKEKNYD